MEKHIVLSDLKQMGELPPTWVVEFPNLVSLLQCFIYPSLTDLPLATELLQHALPKVPHENVRRLILAKKDTFPILYVDFNTEV